MIVYYSSECSFVRGKQIYLAGEFKTTGPLKIPAGMQPTLVTTILRSGGLTSSADLTKVKLLRLEAGKSLVEEGLARGIFFRKEDGSVWIDLTADGLDQKLLLRGDGT